MGRLRGVIATAIDQMRAAGRNGCLRGAALNPDGTGHWWLDRNRTVPFNPATDQEILTGIQYMDDLTGLPVGWRLGPNLANGALLDKRPATDGTVTRSGGIITFANAASGLSSAISQEVTGLEIGKRYRFSARARIASGSGSIRIQNASGGGGSLLSTTVSLTTSFGSQVVEWVATQATAHLTYLGSPSITIEIVEAAHSLQEVIRDESWMGPDLLVGAGDFSAGIGGWYSGTSFTSTASVVSGELQVTATANFGRQLFDITTVAGKSYIVEGQMRKLSGSGTVYVSMALAGQGDAGVIIQTSLDVAQPVRREFTATGALTRVACAVTASGSVGVFDNITVKEIPGNPIVAPVVNQGPIPTKRVNLLQRTQEFDNAAWAKTRATVTANAAIAPDGTMTADALVEDSSNNSHFVSQALTVPAGGTMTVGTFAKASGRAFFALVTFGGAFATTYFDLANGALGTVAAAHTAEIVSVGNGWYWCQVTTASTGTTFTYYPGSAAVNGSASYQGISGTTAIHMWGADVRSSLFNATNFPGIPTYQRVNDGTAGVFDYDHVGFPQFLKQNAAGNAALMTLGTVDMTAGDAGAILANLIVTTNAAGAMVAEMGAAIGNGGAYLIAPSGVSQNNLRLAARGNATKIVDAVKTAPYVTAAIGQWDISDDLLSVTTDGVLVSFTDDLGAGNLNNERFNIGGRDVGGTPSLRFTGLFVGGPPVLVPADAGIDLLALSRALAAEGGYVY